MPQIVEKRLDFEALQQIDEGRIAKLLARHLQNVAADCINRPGDKNPRKVVLEFVVVPVVNPDTGDCERVDMEIEAKSKVPTFRSRKMQMRVSNKGFLFNADFPDELDQQPLLPKEGDE